MSVDQDIHDNCYRVVGQLEALEKLSREVNCMAADSTTAVLLDAARGLLSKAAYSALAYADKRTAETNTLPDTPEAS